MFKTIKKNPGKFFGFSILLIGFLLAIVPLFYTLITSYVQSQYFTFFNPKQLRIYWSLFSQSRILLIFGRTMLLGVGTATISILIGGSFAFVFERVQFKFAKILRGLCLVPILIPPYIITISWMQMFGITGYISKLPIYNLFSTMSIMGLCLFPIVFLIVSAGLKRISSRVEESARLVSGKFRTFWKITLPLLMPYLLTASFFVFVLSISEFGVPMLLHQNVFVSEIFYRFGAFFDHEAAISMTLPLLILVLFLIVIQSKILGKKPVQTINSNFTQKKIKPSKKAEFSIYFFILLILSFSFLIPIASLFYLVNWAGFTYAIRTSLTAIWNSLWISIGGASLLTFFGFFAAYFLSSISGIKKRVLDILIMIPIIIPSSVVGISLIRTWNNPSTSWIYGSILILILVYLTRFLPYAIKLQESNFTQLTKNLEESAHLTGTSFFKIIKKILIPLLFPGIIATWAISFILIIRELGASILVYPPGFETLPIRIFNLVHYNAPESIAALCLLLIVIVLIPLAFIYILYKNQTRKK